MRVLPSPQGLSPNGDCPQSPTRPRSVPLGTVPKGTVPGLAPSLRSVPTGTVPIGTLLALMLCLCLLLLPAAQLHAQTGAPPPMANVQLKDAGQEARALDLMERLRCIQCQGQSIHDSDAPIAAAMRHEVRSRILAGESDAQIESWLISRYGEWISFAPPASGSGLLLWLAPLLLLGAALWVARGRFKKGAQ
jgi:cytochrome c-type biogenesis protein CcmH